jgi:integrase
MARSIRSSTLETRSARLRLPVSIKPKFVRVAKGLGLGYRRNKTGGVWVMRVADGKRSNYVRTIGAADDFADADGGDVLDFWQAQDKVRSLARADRGGTAEPITVKQAIDAYEANLKTRGREVGNVQRIRVHMTNRLASRLITLVTSRELLAWRDSLIDKMTPASVNRTCVALKAALNLVAEQDEKIISRRAWQTGLALIENASTARNVILADEIVRHLIAEAHNESREFGLFVEVAAVTGARESQIARLKVSELKDGSEPRLIMPVSKKGRGEKKKTHYPVPISADLAARLAAPNRRADALLLCKPDGTPWKRSSHRMPFVRVVKACGLNPAEVTMYALRHSSIVRQLLAGVPVRIVAAGHDTSVNMIERTYSSSITDHTDALVRAAMLDMTPRDKAKLAVVG